MNRYSEDPFENGWASEPNPAAYGTASTFLTSLQLLATSPPPPHSPEPIPVQYRTIFAKLHARMALDNSLRTYVLGPLAEDGFLSPRQCTQIAQVAHDHLAPIAAESNFVQALGLVALELQSPGSGDYVTLHYSQSSGLPELPVAAANVLLRESALAHPDPFHAESACPDPLSAALDDARSAEPLDSSLPAPDAPQWAEELQWAEEPQGLLADQSALLIDPSAVEAADDAAVAAYLAEIRGRFQPLVGNEPMVKIKEVPEKEGLLFKHVNYAITHELNLGLHGPRGPKKVVRRYSDFVWLLEFLLQKYPFRVTPGLPPKKFTGMCPDPISSELY